MPLFLTQAFTNTNLINLIYSILGAKFYSASFLPFTPELYIVLYILLFKLLKIASLNTFFINKIVVLAYFIKVKKCFINRK